MLESNLPFPPGKNLFPPCTFHIILDGYHTNLTPSLAATLREKNVHSERLARERKRWVFNRSDVTHEAFNVRAPRVISVNTHCVAQKHVADKGVQATLAPSF